MINTWKIYGGWMSEKQSSVKKNKSACERKEQWSNLHRQTLNVCVSMSFPLFSTYLCKIQEEEKEKSLKEGRGREEKVVG